MFKEAVEKYNTAVANYDAAVGKSTESWKSLTNAIKRFVFENPQHEGVTFKLSDTSVMKISKDGVTIDGYVSSYMNASKQNEIERRLSDYIAKQIEYFNHYAKQLTEK